jgi:glucose-1-phosphate thymidylyltransferase
MSVRALVLARGSGSRMRAADPGATLSEAQRRAADAGLKPLMPIAGRPFLDYVLSSLADAGIIEVGLVIAPGPNPLRRHYEEEAPPVRTRLSCIVQEEPRGTADAVLAAQPWAGSAPFLVLNADNLYPVPVLRALVGLGEPGLPVFDRDDLLATSNIPPERIASFALVDLDAEGYLTRIVEKPSTVPEGPLRISMNCWRFDSGIFGPCRDVPPSPRGELELPQAVMLGVSRGLRLKGIPARGPVFDLSRRADTAPVEARLQGLTVRP